MVTWLIITVSYPVGRGWIRTTAIIANSIPGRRLGMYEMLKNCQVAWFSYCHCISISTLAHQLISTLVFRYIDQRPSVPASAIRIITAIDQFHFKRATGPE